MVMESAPPPPPAVETPAPVRTDESMWSAFQNILTFISLGFFAFALHTLWIVFVNHWFPSGDNGSFYAVMRINSSLAALMVSAPFFLTLFLITNAKYTRHPELKATGSKKTLNYITLVITFVILLVRVISAINTALNNEFTLNFSLNVATTLVITGVIFAYYLYEVRFEKRPASLSGYIAGAAVIALLTAGTIAPAFYVRQAELKKADDIVARQPQPFKNAPPVRPFEAPPVAVATNLPSTPQTVQGITMIIEDARIINHNAGMLLELSMTFAATEPCPLTGGAVCGVSSRSIHATDGDGFKLDPYRMDGPEEMRDTILREGEKIRRKEHFLLSDMTDSYYVTYGTPSGERAEPVEIILEKTDR